LSSKPLPCHLGVRRWLDARGDDLLILTETSAGESATYAREYCRQAGLAR
jgi:hypothetical protein